MPLFINLNPIIVLLLFGVGKKAFRGEVYAISHTAFGIGEVIYFVNAKGGVVDSINFPSKCPLGQI